MSEQRTDIIWFNPCRSWAGTKRPVISADGEGIIRKTNLSGFGVDALAVSVQRFARFVEETGFVTDAERIGWSFVFRGMITSPDKVEFIGNTSKSSWWWGVTGADWRWPAGRHEPQALLNHPITQISWNDAKEFANWAGGRLPSEIEWEHAARGAGADKRYPWGDAEPDDNIVHCNIWQGSFPTDNTCTDGYYGTAPVDAYEPSSSGLYNMSGNVWEWTADRFRVQSLRSKAKARNAEAVKNNERVLKGGSFLCHASYCWRYRIAARSGKAVNSGASHTGFRLAYDSS